jgi:tetratricopeptide (TPR) repeat protein
MANQDAFQAAMKEAADAAWDQDWLRAIDAYRRASEIQPNDSQAVAGLAQSLMEAGQYDKAKTVYVRLSQMVTGDPLPHEKLAVIYERTGNEAEAANEYLAVAEIYFQRNDLRRAIDNWEATARLNPDLAKAYIRLAVVYEKRKDHIPHAIYAYLNVARLLQKFNQLKRAEQALQRAMRLDPTNQDARNGLADLKQGASLKKIAPPTSPGQEAAPTPAVEEDEFLLEAVEEEPGDTPIEEAAEHAMGLLAELVFSGDVPPDAQMPLVQATEMQRIGDAEKAIELYSQAFEAGVTHPALRFLLGLLYQLTNQTRDAINLLSQALDTPEYAIAGHMALGIAHFTQDSAVKGAENLIKALQIADESLNPQDTDSGGYERMLGNLGGQPDDHLIELCKALSIYLEDENWRAKLTDTLSGYAAQGKTSYLPDLMELILEGGRPEIAEIMQRIDRYLLHNKLLLATEEIHHAIEKSPDYLPAHRRLADILVKQNRTREAADKLKLVANTYMVRGNLDKAADLFAESLELWPQDIEARQQVIDMFKYQGRVGEVLRYYGELADTHYSMMADASKALEIYQEALKYANENQSESPQVVAILKAMADIETARLNWNQALKHYKQVITLAPDDENATLEVVELNFQLGQSAQAVDALDAYINHCITRGQAERVISTLEEQVRRHPDEIALRQRLAGVYRQQKRISEAIAQMDALGELQLDAGMREAALETIKGIIELQPPDVESYQQLLEQLENS